MDLMPRTAIAAERSTASDYPDPALLSQVEARIARDTTSTGNAGLSEHLSELESRVEALHQSAEVWIADTYRLIPMPIVLACAWLHDLPHYSTAYTSSIGTARPEHECQHAFGRLQAPSVEIQELGSSCLASHTQDKIGLPETNARGYGSMHPAGRCACDLDSCAPHMCSGAEVGPSKTEEGPAASSDRDHPTRPDCTQPALHDVRWLRDASSTHGACQMKSVPDQVWPHTIQILTPYFFPTQPCSARS